MRLSVPTGQTLAWLKPSMPGTTTTRSPSKSAFAFPKTKWPTTKIGRKCMSATMFLPISTPGFSRNTTTLPWEREPCAFTKQISRSCKREFAPAPLAASKVGKLLKWKPTPSPNIPVPVAFAVELPSWEMQPEPSPSLREKGFTSLLNLPGCAPKPSSKPPMAVSAFPRKPI